MDTVAHVHGIGLRLRDTQSDARDEAEAADVQLIHAGDAGQVDGRIHTLVLSRLSPRHCLQD